MIVLSFESSYDMDTQIEDSIINEINSSFYIAYFLVNINPFIINIFLNNLINYKKIVLKIFERIQNIEVETIFNLLSNKIKDDKQFILKILNNNSCLDILEYVSSNLQADKEVVLTAVKSRDNALKYASHELLANKKFVLEVVKLNRHALKYVSDELLNY